jgi:AmmeMemoRadiSam system protein B
MGTISELRPSAIAGRWYPLEADLLAKSVDSYLSEARLPELSGEVVGLVAPHAGHIYSGVTAGHAFASVRGKTIPRVVVISPLHSFHPADVLTSAHQGYQTPLGTIRIDQDALAALERDMQARGLPALERLSRDSEHALEIELPFLQRALAGPFELVPLMVRTHDPDRLQALGGALAEMLVDFPALLVASTDLSHFFPRAVADMLDGAMLARIAELSPERVLEAESSGVGQACGVGAVAAMLWAARAVGANAVEVVHYSTSGEQTGEYREVVGYGAAIILKR